MGIRKTIRESPTKSIFIHGFAPESHATFSELLQCPHMNAQTLLKHRESRSFSTLSHPSLSTLSVIEKVNK